MESPERKMQYPIDIDRISDLPSEIKENILNRIPIVEAVRACILSSKWRSIWKSIPDLTFSYAIIRSLKPNLSNELSKFIRFLDMFLLLHNGPIRKFILNTSLPCHDQFEKWIVILSRNKIEEIFVEFESCNRIPHVVPYHFFSCTLLRQIHLANCIMDVPPLFEGFKLLHTLKLYNVAGNDDSFNRFISKSPNLQNLCLLGSWANLIINAPNLKILKIVGRWEKIRLVTPSLKHLSLESGANSGIDGFDCLSQIEEVEIPGHFIKIFSEILFVHLKMLKLQMDLSDHKLASFALSLLQNNPMLEKLYIKTMVEQDMGQVNGTFWKSAPRENLCTNLKHFEICHHHESNSLCAFAKVVLSTASILETFYIINPVLAPPVRKLLLIKRASNNVEVYVPRNVWKYEGIGEDSKGKVVFH